MTSHSQFSEDRDADEQAAIDDIVPHLLATFSEDDESEMNCPPDLERQEDRQSGDAVTDDDFEEHQSSIGERDPQTPEPRSLPIVQTPETCVTYSASTPDGTPVPEMRGNSESVVIEHRVKREGNASSKMITSMKKPLVGVLVLLLSGSAAFLFTRWLSIPGLESQIDRLKNQVDELEKQVDRLEDQVSRLSEEVDRLDSEVDRLSAENNRYAELNDLLASNITEYQKQNERLRNSTAWYQELNEQLSTSNSELEQLNQELREQNEQYQELNQELNQTSTLLKGEVDRLESLTMNLTETNDELKASVQLLSDQVDTISAENWFLNSTVFSLRQEVLGLTNETERLSDLNANLANIVSFLNETAGGIDDTYNAISDFLSEQIVAYRGFVLDTHRNVYLQRITNWDCDFRSFFLTMPFVRNASLPIGATHYEEVADYIDERILSELCLNTLDYEQFLEAEFVKQGEFPPVNANVNQLRQSVQRYTRSALAHYFANDGSENGPNSTDWARADYDCGNLPQEKLFLMYS